jgi:hypothetical protein
VGALFFGITIIVCLLVSTSLMAVTGGNGMFGATITERLFTDAKFAFSTTAIPAFSIVAGLALTMIPCYPFIVYSKRRLTN